MKAWQRILISSLSNGAIAFVGAATAVLVEAGDDPVSTAAWLISAFAGVMAMAKDWRAFTADAPKD